MFNWLPCGLQAQKAFPAHECTDQQQAQELHAALKEGLLLLNGHGHCRLLQSSWMQRRQRLLLCC